MEKAVDHWLEWCRVGSEAVVQVGVGYQRFGAAMGAADWCVRRAVADRELRWFAASRGRRELRDDAITGARQRVAFADGNGFAPPHSVARFYRFAGSRGSVSSSCHRITNSGYPVNRILGRRANVVDGNWRLAGIGGWRWHQSYDRSDSSAVASWRSN